VLRGDFAAALAKPGSIAWQSQCQFEGTHHIAELGDV
jgi:hypothetical protein